MSIVFGNISLIMTKYISMDILVAPHWNYYVRVSHESREQLEFWRNEILNLSARDMYINPSYSKIVYSDSSSYAYGGYEVTTIESVTYSIWSPEEMLLSRINRSFQGFKIYSAFA